jgi:thioredoxin reductase
VANTYDVTIIGGGPAGLAAALVLARSRCSTLLIDAGAPRNAPAPAMHGFVTRDGASAREFRDAAIAQLRQYPLFELRHVRAERVDGGKGDFAVQLSGGDVALCRRLLLCTGLEEDLSELDGLPEAWGKAAFDCPYCHGWEARDKVFGYVTSGDGCLEFALLLQSWASRVVVFSNQRALEPGLEAALAKHGVALESRSLRRVVSDADGRLEGVEVADGSITPCEALFLKPPQHQTALVRALRLELDDQGMVRVNADMETSLSGVSAAGDLSSHTHGALVAAASGSTAAHALHRALTTTR